MKTLSKVALGAVGTGLTVAAGLVAYTAFNGRRAMSNSPASGRFMDLDGARIHYVDEGEGFPIVLIHGLGGQLRNFTQALTPRLRDRFRVISVDRPGSGYSTVTAGAQPDLAAQAATLAEFIERLELDKPLVVGHSLGGAVALALALEHPDSVGALALLSPLTHRQDVVPEVFKALVIESPTLRHLVAWTLAAPLGRLNRARGRALVFGPDAAPADFDTVGGGALTLRPASFYAAASEASAGSEELGRLVARYPALSVPVAILFARDDRILDPAIHGEPLVAASSRVRLDLIDGGHMFPVTRPDETARWIAAGVERLSARRS